MPPQGAGWRSAAGEINDRIQHLNLTLLKKCNPQLLVRVNTLTKPVLLYPATLQKALADLN